MNTSRKSDSPLTSVSPWTQLLHLSAVVGVVLAGGQRMAAQSDVSGEPDGTTLSILGPELQDYGWTPGMAPTAAEAELEDMSAVRRGYFAMPGVSAGFDFLFDQLDELYTSTGVRMGAAYTLLFQGLSGGPWDQYGGAGFRGLMGEPNDMAGIAFSYAFPSDSSLRQEKVLEGFNRWQLTRFSQASVGAQAIFDPGNGPDHDVVGAFWGRLRIVF